MLDDTFQFDPPAPWVSPGWFDKLCTWGRRRRQLLLIFAGVFQVGVLAAMVVIHAAPLVVGKTILLKVEPWDPRDLFRGDYVALAYAIGSEPPQGIQGIAPSSKGGGYFEPEERTVYVALAPQNDGKCWKAVNFSLERPAAGTYLRGVYHRNAYGMNRLTYGIETYYVPEGTGHRYEDAARRHHLLAEIGLAPWGQATLRRLLIE